MKEIFELPFRRMIVRDPAWLTTGERHGVNMAHCAEINRLPIRREHMVVVGSFHVADGNRLRLPTAIGGNSQQCSTRIDDEPLAIGRPIWSLNVITHFVYHALVRTIN